MLETERIAGQLQRAFFADAWYGPALRKLLTEVAADMAFAKPLPGGHSIWELVLHAAAWKRVVCQWLAGEAAKVTPEEDWPEVPDTSEAAWEQALEALEASHRELEEALSALSDSRLNDPVPGKDFSLYFVLHGVAQHDAYHAGQIALLKKLHA